MNNFKSKNNVNVNLVNSAHPYYKDSGVFQLFHVLIKNI